MKHVSFPARGISFFCLAYFIFISYLALGYFITSQADFSLFISLLAPGYLITSQADFSLFISLFA